MIEAMFLIKEWPLPYNDCPMNINKTRPSFGGKVCQLSFKMADKMSGYVSTVASSEALQLYNEAVELFVNHKGSFIELVKRAIEIENDFILARCLLVRIHVYVHK